MMNCEQFREQLLSDPGTREASVLEHRLACVSCREFAHAAQAFDQTLVEALKLPVPEGLKARVMAQIDRSDTPDDTGNTGHVSQSGVILRWAAAAVMVVSVGSAAFIWQSNGGKGAQDDGALQAQLPPTGLSGDSDATPSASDATALPVGNPQNQLPARALVSELVEHIEHEPGLLAPTERTLPAEAVEGILRRVDATLSAKASMAVSYAGMCDFRGNLVPHLVVQGKTGPITVMLLPDEHVSGPMSVEEGDFKGTIFPSRDGGSVAIVGGTEEDIPAVQKSIFESVEWSI